MRFVEGPHDHEQLGNLWKEHMTYVRTKLIFCGNYLPLPQTLDNSVLSHAPTHFHYFGDCVRGSLPPTFTAPRVVNKVIVQSPTIAQLVPAFVVVSCSVGSAYWVLIGGAVVKTHAACFMSTVCLAHSKRWAVEIKTRIQV